MYACFARLSKTFQLTNTSGWLRRYLVNRYRTDHPRCHDRPCPHLHRWRHLHANRCLWTRPADRCLPQQLASLRSASHISKGLCSAHAFLSLIFCSETDSETLTSSSWSRSLQDFTYRTRQTMVEQKDEKRISEVQFIIKGRMGRARSVADTLHRLEFDLAGY